MINTPNEAKKSVDGAIKRLWRVKPYKQCTKKGKIIVAIQPYEVYNNAKGLNSNNGGAHKNETRGLKSESHFS